MFEFDFPLWGDMAVFAAAGAKAAALADRLADRTGLGEAIPHFVIF